jgi:transposase
MIQQIPIVQVPAVGVDTGDKWSHICVRDATGDVASELRIRTTRESVRKFFSTLVRCRVALEVGTHSRWIAEELEKLGFEVYVANARRLRAIYQSDTKTDKCDARFLAEIVAVKPSLLCPIKHRGEQAQSDLALLRARAALVKTRTLLINHVRSTIKSMGGRLAKTSSGAFHRQVDAIPDERRMVLEPLMKQIREQTAYIRGYDKTIEERGASYPAAALLRKVAGVGPVVALSFICTIEDPHRFANVRKIASYLGLRQRLDESGELRKELPITKAGDTDLRRHLVTSAQFILGPLGPDCDLRRWGTNLVERGGSGSKKKAVVAVARKLAVLLLSLWKSGAEYDPLRRAKQEAASADNQQAPAAQQPRAIAEGPAIAGKGPETTKTPKSVPSRRTGVGAKCASSTARKSQAEAATTS